MFANIPWHSIGRFALVIVCLAVVLALIVVVLPIYLDITAFKGPVERILTGIAEAPVTVEHVRLHPSPWPELRVSGVEVAGTRGENPPPFSRIDNVEIRLSLIPLLRRELRLQKLAISGARFHAHRPEGGSGNWPVWKDSSFQVTELAGVALESVTLDLEDHHSVRATITIDQLACEISKSRPLDLEMHGSLQGLPMVISAGGPTLAVPLSQASDFPLFVDLQLADLELHVEGSASREPGGTKFQFAFDLASDRLAFVRELTKMDLPRIGGVEWTGRLSNRESMLEISDIEGSFGGSPVYGHLALDRHEKRTEITARLALDQLDLAPWLAARGQTDSTASDALPFSYLQATNAKLHVSVGEVKGLRSMVEELDLEVDITEGRLTAPATLRVADIPLSALLEVQADQDMPEISSRIWTRELTLTQLDRIVDIPDNLEGRFETLDLEITSSGESIEVLRANLQVEAQATETELILMDETGQQPIETLLHQVHAIHRPGEPLVISTRGDLLEKQFTLALRTAPLSKVIGNDHWPLTVSLHGAGAELELDGTLERDNEGFDLDLGFQISGDHLGELDNWLGLPPDLDLPYSLQGSLSSAAGTRLLRLEDSSLGRSRFGGEFAWSTDDVDEPFMIDLRATALDLRQLREPSDAVTRLDTQEDSLGIDVPILPTRLRLHDAEIDLQVDRLLRDTVDLTDVRASFHVRQAHLAPSPFSFSYHRQHFTGEINLDLRGEIPTFSLELEGDGEEIGEILAREGFVDNVEIAASQLKFRIDASGASVREIIHSADLKGQIQNLRWQFEAAELDDPVNLQLGMLHLSGPKGEPIELTGNGILEEEPLDFRLTLRFPSEPEHGPRQSMPFRLDLNLAATAIRAEGEALLPITSRRFDLDTLVEGESLASFSSLLDRDLPALGPYRLQGLLILGEQELRLEDLDLDLGESDVHGTISYVLENRRPTFVADLTSRAVHIMDFIDAPGAVSDNQEQQQEDRPIDDESTAGSPLNLSGLNGFDARIDLRADEVITASGQLDQVTIEAELERGSLDLVVRRPQVDNEDAQLTARIRPWQQGIEAQIRAVWARQPYGLLAAILNPGTAGGSWGVDLDLSTRGSDLQELMSNLSGHLFFADYPIDMKTTMFDLWGGGLINSLLPVFQLGSESRLNCTVAKFKIDQGIFTPNSLIIDSTRTRVRGKGFLDLPGNEIRLTLKPRPKQRNLINLSTPVKIRGPLLEPDVQISKGGLALTFFRLSLWAYTVWRDIARSPLPADGHDICVDPFVTVTPEK